MESCISMVVEATGKMITKEVNMLCGVKKQVEEIKNDLQMMQRILEDADYRVTSQPQQQQSSVFRQQILQVREAKLDVEDIVDTYLVNLALRKRGGVVNLIKKYACFLEHCWDIHVVGSEIEALKYKLSTLRSSLQNYGEPGVGDSGGYTKSLQRRSYGHIQDRNIVGLDKNVNDVVGLLACKVVSIYGMGGLGKTTLAKKVYNDKRVRTHFDKFAWVYVSQQFKERDVWESALIQLTSPTSEQREEISKLKDDEIASKLYQVQKDHKSAVVLDDIWSIQDWERLRAGFPHEETGDNAILFTTRNKEVSERANHRGSYGGLKHLKDPNDMELLRKIAFEGRDHEIPDSLARGMLNHCDGLPLAIVVLGGILASKDSLGEWQKVHDNINAYLRMGRGHNEEEGLGVHHVLAYSYYDLPCQLKTCFLYLSQYPEDYEIKTKKLMRMWMAEGFVSVEYDGEGEETAEDVAERYLNELAGRCVIQVAKKGFMGRIKTCRLHDLMRDVCLSKAKEENFIHNYQNGAGKMRRVSLIGGNAQNEQLLSIYREHSHIRSIICDNVSLGPVRLEDSFKLLKMLLLERMDLRGVKGLSMSKGIGKLIHLTYLSLRDSVIDDWPSLDKLGLMETLDLRVKECPVIWDKKYLFFWRGLFKVGEIWKMKQLKNLYLPDTDDTIRVSIDGADAESNLNMQRLINFPLPNCRVGRIFKFPNLRKLRMKMKQDQALQLWEILNDNKGFVFNHLYSFTLISYDVGNPIEALFAKCPHLLKLNVKGRIDKFPQLNQFPTKLTKLILFRSEIEDPKHIETTLGDLPYLTTLKLGSDSFMGEQLSFKKHTFPRLTTLCLSCLSELKNWTVEQGAMPNLEHLEIKEVKKLEAIPEGLRFIATLKELKISWMLAEFAARIKEGGADFDIVKDVPSITFLGCDD